MNHRHHHPSKEQVRAYMVERETARRPPPTPEEIRRRLGWRLTTTEDDQRLVQLCLIPSAYSQMVARLTLEWFFAPLRLASRPRD